MQQLGTFRRRANQHQNQIHCIGHGSRPGPNPHTRSPIGTQIQMHTDTDTWTDRNRQHGVTLNAARTRKTVKHQF